MELLEVLITLPLRKRNRTCGCYYGKVYQQLLIRLMKIMRLYIASGTASATGTINDNDAAPTATITPASATEGSPVLNSA
jgi:hypothetical protein